MKTRPGAQRHLGDPAQILAAGATGGLDRHAVDDGRHITGEVVAVGGMVGDPGTDVAALDRQFRVNVGGVAVAVRAAAALMRDGGWIISIGSMVGERVVLLGLFRLRRDEGGGLPPTREGGRGTSPRGITVNSRAARPGRHTDMNPDGTEFAATLKSATALGRYGKPEEIAAAVAFLASPEAAFITSATLNVDGGLLA